MTNMPPTAPGENERPRRNPQFSKRAYPLLVLAALLLGALTAFLIWGRSLPAPLARTASAPDGQAHAGDPAEANPELASLMEQINPSGGYALPARYGDLGPRLVKAGVIDLNALAAIFENDGTPLSQEEMGVLTAGSEQGITITSQNSRFLLNLFWAVGLANQNPILTAGPIVENSGGQVERFASTGGWTLASRPITEIYASLDLITLTEEQQRRVEEVAAAVYRPCCDNPTHFPDCNHGMAMLGLLELMASQGAGSDEMFTAAKYINAFWFPQQTLEMAVYLKAVQNIEFADADARLVVGRNLSSGSGAKAVHQALQSAGLLQPDPGQGNSCSS